MELRECVYIEKGRGMGLVITITTESLAVTARISAHETTPGHTFSTADLMLSMTSNPRAEFLLGIAFFSPVKLDVSSSRIEPSHPCSSFYFFCYYQFKQYSYEDGVGPMWTPLNFHTPSFSSLL